MTVDKMGCMIFPARNPKLAPMLKHDIENHGRDRLQFSGRLIVAAKSDPCCVEVGSRWLELSLFETAEGDFVAGIKFCTTVPGEVSIPVFERLDEVTSAENFFFAFEPDEYLRKSNGESPLATRELIAAELYAEFEIAVRDVISWTTMRRESQRNGVEIQSNSPQDMVR